MNWVIPRAMARVRAQRKMPRQKPGKSEQTVGTPEEFIMAVEERFGPLTIDLASDAANAKAPMWIPPERDSLKVKWFPTYEGNAWLNPPFGDCKTWAAKCARMAKRMRGDMDHPEKPGDRIFLLTPASVGANWFRDHVYGKALVLALSPRLKFVGHLTHFPKDLILSVYGEKPGFALWDWKGRAT